MKKILAGLTLAVFTLTGVAVAKDNKDPQTTEHKKKPKKTKSSSSSTTTPETNKEKPKK
jgi:hypothetical protein